MASSKQDLRAFERTRAANFVKAYEDELRSKLSANPTANNAVQVATLIDRLSIIRGQIMGSMKNYTPSIKRDPDGGFSLEEIEAAMDFVQSDKNPFED